MDEISGLVQQFTGGQADPQQVGQAADQHLNSVPPSEVQQQLQTAADNAENNGNGELASTIRNMLDQHGGGQGIVGEAVTLIKSNPQVLQHFEPEFVRGILSKI
ncbi:MAG TPA: hypothetical protein VFL13_15445 [Candidatus Baltobacteraceae bacterium]|nr:hypothetical protein [Candidatus Baltobacteraceae bacterium]